MSSILLAVTNVFGGVEPGGVVCTATGTHSWTVYKYQHKYVK